MEEHGDTTLTPTSPLLGDDVNPYALCMLRDLAASAVEPPASGAL